MSLICNYFVAASDMEAGATLDWDGGPSTPSAGSSHRPLATFAFPGIEPVVMMGMLEHLLTGRDVEPIIEANSESEVAVREGGHRLVIRLSDGLADALAATPDERLREVALPWSQMEQLWGKGDADELAAGLVELARLVRTRSEVDKAVYCWVSV